MEPTLSQRFAVLTFMGLVTGWLLALVFAKAGSAAAAPVEIVVYALTAAFGLEFLMARWRATFGPP